MEKSEKSLILFMPSIEGGGVEKNLILITNFLSLHLNGIKLITFDNRYNKFFNKKVKIINEKKFNKNQIYSKYHKYFRCLKLLINEFYKNKNILVFSFQANIYCIILSVILGFKVLVRSNSSPSGWTKNFIKNFIFKIFFKFPIKIIVNSYKFKSQIDEQFKIKSEVIYNPLNKKEILKLSKTKVDLKKIFSKKSLKIINIGRFTDQKDHMTLLKSIRLVKKKINVKLLLIGYGPNLYKIQNYIRQHSLLKNVKILPFKRNVYKYIKVADLFVLTSIFEGLPNVLLEAITLKKFIISTDCPTGPKEILNNGKYGDLIKIGDYENLASKILKFNLHKKKYKTKIEKAYKSLNRFDFDKNCKLYLTTIKREL